MTHKHGSSLPTWGRVISARKWLSVWLMRQSVFRPFRPFGCLITSVSRLNPSNQPARGSCTGLLSRDLPSIRMSTWSPIPQAARNAGGMRMPRELPIFRMQVRMSRLWPRSACKSPSAGYWPGYIIASSSPWRNSTRPSAPWCCGSTPSPSANGWASARRSSPPSRKLSKIPEVEGTEWMRKHLFTSVEAVYAQITKTPWLPTGCLPAIAGL